MEVFPEYSNYCGVPPICRCFMGFLICSTLEMRELPYFNISMMLKTIHIDISVNNFTEPPYIVSSQWPLLNSIDLRENKQLTCSKVMEFITSNPSLSVYHDCNKNKFEVVFLGNNTWMTSNRNPEIMKENFPTETSTEENRNDNHLKPNLRWTIESILLLSEALILTIGIFMFVIYRTIRVTRRSFMSRLNFFSSVHGVAEDDPGQLHPLRSSATQIHLPNVTTSETTV